MSVRGARQGTEPFVGRERELRELERVLDRAASGRGELVLVAGDAGMGKTALVEEASRRVQEAGFQCLWARCWEAHATPPLWPWKQLLAALTSLSSDVSGASAGAFRVAAPSRTSDRAAAEVARFVAFDEAAATVRAAAARRPLLLVIDDLHAADVTSIELLAFLGPLLRFVPVVVIGTYRIEEVDARHPLGARLPDLVRWGRQLVLSGVGGSEVAALVAGLSGAVPSGAAVAAIAERTGGNPLFVRELFRLSEADPTASDGVETTSKRGMPTSVRAVLDRRLATLSPECGRVLAVASVVGSPFDVEVVAEVTGVAGALLTDPIDEAITAGIVLGADFGHYRFTHGLFAEALYDELGEGGRAELHARVGAALERLRERGHDVEPAELARHFVAAAGLGSWDKAASYCLEAGDRAMESLAHEDAMRHYQRALACTDHLPRDERRRARGLVSLAEAAAACGERGLSRAACVEAAELARRDGSAELLARAALCFTSDPAGFEVVLFDREQVALLREALAALDEGSPLRARVLARLSVALSLAAPLEDRRELAEQAVAAARASEDEGAVGYALAAHCDTIAGPADVEHRLAAAEEIVDLAVTYQDRRLQLLGHRLRLVALLERGDALQAKAAVESYAEVAEQAHQPLYRWFVPLWRGAWALANGEFGECERRLREASALGTKARSTNAALMCGVQPWFLLMETGRAADGLDVLQEVIGSFTQPGSVQRISLALGLGAAGRLDEAVAHLDAISDDDLAAVPQDSEWLPMLAELSEAVALVGGHRLAAWTYDALRPHRHLFSVEGIGAVMIGSVEHHLGLLAASLGLPTEAAGHFRAALGAHRRMESTLLVARTLRASGAGADPGVTPEGAGTCGHLGAGMPIGGDGRPPVSSGERDRERSGNVFKREGEYWTLVHGGTVARVRDMKGLHDIAQLLGRPGREVHVLDLAGAAAASRDTYHEGDLGEVLDVRARKAYRSRVNDLGDEIDEAEQLGDSERAAQARHERDMLVDQLATAYGLGGRARRSGDPSERARSTVTRRIHDALRRIDQAHPELGTHLRRSIRTGTFCAYEPDQPIDWTT